MKFRAQLYKKEKSFDMAVPLQCTIRIAQADDLQSIIDIYNQAVAAKKYTADTTPLKSEDRINWFLEHTPNKHPIFVAESKQTIAGWCSISEYRAGRAALRYTAEISYYVSHQFHRQGIATKLVQHALAVCPELQIKNLFALVLESNENSLRLLKKFGFERWGYLPRVAEFEGEEVGQFIYGKRVWDG